MSEKKSILDKIKQLFVDALPTSFKLADGTDVTISLLDVGGDFSIGGLPGAEGTYTLMDGTNVTVDSTGKITEVSEPSDFQATEYTLSGGDKITIDKLEVGGAVMKDGVAVETGDYALEDGTTFTTDANGIITVLVLPTAAAAESSDAKVTLTKEQIQQAYDEINAAPAADQLGKLVICVKALMDYAFGWQIDNATSPQEAVEDAKQVADAIEAYVNMEKQYKAKFEKQDNIITKQGETITQILKLMTELAEAPAGDPPIERKTIFSGDVQSGKKAGLAKYAEAAQKMNEQSQTANN